MEEPHVEVERDELERHRAERPQVEAGRVELARLRADAANNASEMHAARLLQGKAEGEFAKMKAQIAELSAQLKASVGRANNVDAENAKLWGENDKLQKTLGENVVQVARLQPAVVDAETMVQNLQEQ